MPFYYGWVIWLLSTAGILVSIPGQTMGMAVFTDHFIDALGLSRTELSLAYLVGTVSSSLFLTRAGRWYDWLGGRLMVALAAALLALMLVYIAAADSIAARFGGGVLVSFAAITVGYFGVRFLGQGVLTSASRNVLLVWFEKRRGLVSSARGTFVSFGFAIAPLVLAWMIANGGWREALWELALICLVFAAIALLLLRDNPASCGVLIDGHSDDNPPPKTVFKASCDIGRGTADPGILAGDAQPEYALLVRHRRYVSHSLNFRRSRAQSDRGLRLLPPRGGGVHHEQPFLRLARRHPLAKAFYGHHAGQFSHRGCGPASPCAGLGLRAAGGRVWLWRRPVVCDLQSCLHSQFRTIAPRRDHRPVYLHHGLCQCYWPRAFQRRPGLCTAAMPLPSGCALRF